MRQHFINIPLSSDNFLTAALCFDFWFFILIPTGTLAPRITSCYGNASCKYQSSSYKFSLQISSCVLWYLLGEYVDSVGGLFLFKI